MRIVVDINYGVYNTKTMYGIYDYETNTLEYISSTKLIKKVTKEGYDAMGLVLRNIDPQHPDAYIVDLQHTCVACPPGLERNPESSSQGFYLDKPIYVKGITSKFRLNYKNCTFVYEKHNKSEDIWNILLPNPSSLAFRDVTLQDSAQAIIELLPYLPKVDKINIQSVTRAETLDLSCFAPLSRDYKVVYDIEASGCENIKISGNAENIDASLLYDTLSSMKLLDLSDLCLPMDKHNCCVNHLASMKHSALILLPANLCFLQNTINTYKKEKHKEDTYTFDGKDGILYLGYLPKKDYQYYLKTEMAKHALMGKKMTNMLCLVAVHY